MNLKIIIHLILFCPLLLRGQNKVQNGAFGDTIQANFGLVKPEKWESPTLGSPDFFHPDSRSIVNVPGNFAGYQEAKEDQGYYGFLIFSLNSPNSREYIQNELSDSLKHDSVYCFQAFISLSDSSNYSTGQIFGIYLSKNRINSNTQDTLIVTPQLSLVDTSNFEDKHNWVSFTGNFKADGGERFLTIGNFSGGIPSDTNRINGGFAKQYLNAYYYIDNIYLGHCDSVPNDTLVSIAEKKYSPSFKGYPNPTQNEFYVESRLEEALEFQWFNAVGQNIVVPFQTRSTASSAYAFSLGDLPKGIYLLNVISKTERATLKVVKE